MTRCATRTPASRSRAVSSEKLCALTDKIKGLKLEVDFTEEMRDNTADLVEEKWNSIPVDVSSKTEVWDGFMRVLGGLCTKEEKKQALIGYSYTSRGRICLAGDRVTPPKFGKSAKASQPRESRVLSVQDRQSRPHPRSGA